MNFIAFTEGGLQDILKGAKTITIRQGIREYDENLVVTNPDGEAQSFTLKVVSCKSYLVSEIPAKAVDDDGFMGYYDFLAEMTRFYPEFNENSECTVVRFERVDKQATA